jgi:hypothetical protein
MRKHLPSARGNGKHNRLMLEMKTKCVVRQATCAVKNLILAMNGEKPIAQVNPEVPVKKVN